MALTLFGASLFLASAVHALAANLTNVLTAVVALALVGTNRLIAVFVFTFAALVTYACAYVIRIVTVALVSAVYILIALIGTSATDLTSVITGRNGNVGVVKHLNRRTGGVHFRIPLTVCNKLHGNSGIKESGKIFRRKGIC